MTHLKNLQQLAYMRKVIAKQRCDQAGGELESARSEYDAKERDFQNRDKQNRQLARDRLNSLFNERVTKVELTLATLAHQDAEQKSQEHSESLDKQSEIVQEYADLLHERQTDLSEKYKKYEKLRILSEHPDFVDEW